MSILILGKSVCSICNSVIEEGQKSISFPPFIRTQMDPLYLFHDSSFHESCFRSHPLSENAIILHQEMYGKTSSGNRNCQACLKSIDDPDDHFTLGHLISDITHPLYLYNYCQFHLSCIPQWTDRAYVKQLILTLQSCSACNGGSIKSVLDKL